MATNSTVINVDFSDVKESSGINPKHQPEGDYLLKITKAEVGKNKNDDLQVLVLFQDPSLRSATYPYYCPLTPKMMWKIRNVFIAAGLQVPKAKGKLDVARLVNKEVGCTLADDEYEGKMKSVIDAVFHKDELEPQEGEDEDFEEEVEEDEIEEEEEAPAPKKSKKKPAPVVEEEEDDEEEDEEEEEPEPAPVKKKAKKKAAPVVEEEDEDDDELDLDDI